MNRDIQLKFCRTQSFWMTIRHPFLTQTLLIKQYLGFYFIVVQIHVLDYTSVNFLE